MNIKTIILIIVGIGFLQNPGISQRFLKVLKENKDIKEIKVYSFKENQEQSSPDWSQFKRRVTHVFSYEPTNKTYISISKDICCKDRKRKKVYKYDENWNLMEKVEYKISEDRRDTIAHNMILYRYNEKGNIEQTSEYDYVVSSSSWEIQADKILQYAYNKKGLEVLRTTKHSIDNAYQIKNYTKSTYNRKGNKIKEKYYSDLPGDQGIKKISTTRFKYDPESNQLINKITKNKYIEWREEYYYQEDKLIRTIKYEKETIEDEKEKTEYFDYIYKNDLLIKLKHYRIEEEESDFSFSIYKYIKR